VTLSFSRKAVEKTTGLPFTLIQQYTDKGFVVPEIHNPIGRGTNRIYSINNLIEFLLCKKMVDLGITHKLLKDLSLQIREKKIAEKILNQKIDFISVSNQKIINTHLCRESFSLHPSQENLFFLNVKKEKFKCLI